VPEQAGAGDVDLGAAAVQAGARSVLDAQLGSGGTRRWSAAAAGLARMGTVWALASPPSTPWLAPPNTHTPSIPPPPPVAGLASSSPPPPPPVAGLASSSPGSPLLPLAARAVWALLAPQAKAPAAGRGRPPPPPPAGPHAPRLPASWPAYFSYQAGCSSFIQLAGLALPACQCATRCRTWSKQQTPGCAAALAWLTVMRMDAWSISDQPVPRALPPPAAAGQLAGGLAAAPSACRLLALLGGGLPGCSFACLLPAWQTVRAAPRSL
jgi:hypothetical protein